MSAATRGGSAGIRLAVIALLALAATGCGRGGSDLSEADIAINNRGVALMGYFDYPAARDAFEQAVERRPDWLDARVNMAIATLNRQQEGDEQRALEILANVLEDDPGHLRARYMSGLLNLYLGETEASLTHLRMVAQADPADAYVAYFIGQNLLQKGDLEATLGWYQRAIELDPYLRSAYYGAALVLRRLDRRDEARAMLASYERFDGNPRARLAEFKYTRMGPKGSAVAIARGDIVTPPVPAGDLFEAPIDLTARLTTGDATLTAADVNGDGRLDLFLAQSGGTQVLMADAEGGFSAGRGHVLAGVTGVIAALWGDIDNDGHLDLYLCRVGPNQLWLSDAAGNWREKAVSFGVDDAGACADAGLFDADHDGDLDVFVVNADGPNELLSNNLNGSFRRLAAAQGLVGSGSGRQLLVADLDADRDADLLVINDGGGNEVWLNDRLWQYRPAPGLDSFRNAALRAAVAADRDADGRDEIYGIAEDGTMYRWVGGSGDQWVQMVWGRIDGARPYLEPADFNGDGVLELLAGSSAGVAVLGSNDSVTAVSGAEGLIGPALILNRDVSAGPELIAPVATGLRVWRPGPGRFRFLGLSFTGKEDQAESMRSNRSGIGTRVLLRRLDNWTVVNTLDGRSAPGQSLQPLAIGLAGRDQADYVAIDWSDGVFQTELDLEPGRVHRIAETQRQLSSCPVVFAWDGERYRFVSDILGVGGLGFFLEPGVYAEPRPWEYFLLPEDTLSPRSGRYHVKISEPMEESAYLDAVRLHTYDLPPGWDLVLDERMATGAPAVTGRPIFFTRQRDPRSVRNGRGEDVSSSVRAVDQRAAPPGPLDSRFIGRLADEHSLILEFDAVINPPDERPVLVADGWVEYPYSQTVFAAWQAGVRYEPPSLDARTADGDWHRVHTAFGYPAGMPRVMALPLDALPDNTVALRLTTTQEVYWDRLRIVYEEPPPPALRSSVRQPLLARLAKSGFPLRHTRPQRLPDYDYEIREAFWDARYLDGYYTRLGRVEPLLTELDDAVAIIGSGEEVHLEFAAPDGAPAAGWRRRFVLEAHGWAKDMDMYTRDGGRLAPLPRRRAGPAAADDVRQALHDRYNLRYQSGR